MYTLLTQNTKHVKRFIIRSIVDYMADGKVRDVGLSE